MFSSETCRGQPLQNCYTSVRYSHQIWESVRTKPSRSWCLFLLSTLASSLSCFESWYSPFANSISRPPISLRHSSAKVCQKWEIYRERAVRESWRLLLWRSSRSRRVCLLPAFLEKVRAFMKFWTFSFVRGLHCSNNRITSCRMSLQSWSCTEENVALPNHVRY